ncbi:MAG: tetratricopeptide repeat protein, partial [Caldilineales bacterium]|nr:tetratricopeptide repeat protein [Caldilineales bacterium]
LYKANPRDLVAANNLAWIYGEMKDPRAVKQAEAAYALAPEHPSTLDTLGWILVQQGQTERGIELLRKAVAKRPDQPELRWHLAYAYHRKGDAATARRELELLLNNRQHFPQQQEAIALYNRLK